MQGMDMSSGPMKWTWAACAGKAPADARNSDDYSDGYRNSALPNYEMADQIKVPKLLAEELEFTSGNEGKGMAGRSSQTALTTTSSG
jgi:copper resistance protein B